jgi:alpha-glucoside transport system substrate-binding protein
VEEHEMTIRMSSRRRAIALAATGASLALVLAACADTDEGGGGDGGGDGGEPGAYEIDCSVFEEFGDLEGTSVDVYTTIVEPEAETQTASYEPFE